MENFKEISGNYQLRTGQKQMIFTRFGITTIVFILVTVLTGLLFFNSNLFTSKNKAAGFNNSKSSINKNHNEIISEQATLLNALPVELSSFNASIDKNSVKLQWKTLSEKNNDYFTVKRSFDGKNFTDLKRIDGAGNSDTSISYNFTDRNPHFGTIYYQLTQTDFNGHSENFNIISIHMEDKTEVMSMIPDSTQNSMMANFAY